MSFDTVNYLLFEKRKQLDNGLLEEFSPYVTMKSFSFYGGGIYCDYINDSLNRFQKLFEQREDLFRFYENIIPIQKRKRITYLKRKKEDKKEEPEPIPEFYSKREIDMLKDLSNYIHEPTCS